MDRNEPKIDYIKRKSKEKKDNNNSNQNTLNEIKLRIFKFIRPRCHYISFPIHIVHHTYKLKWTQRMPNIKMSIRYWSCCCWYGGFICITWRKCCVIGASKRKSPWQRQRKSNQFRFYLLCFLSFLLSFFLVAHIQSKTVYLATFIPRSTVRMVWWFVI